MSQFDTVEVKKINSSTFDMSYDHKLSLKMGQLVPINVMEALPGDKLYCSSEAMFRMMPMIAPIMHKVEIFIHHFFVPNRIVWDHWERFITGGQDPNDNLIAYPVINFENENITPSHLADYMGIPVGTYTGASPSSLPINAIPFAAYQRIWYDYYRDQNLQDLGLLEPLKLSDGIQSDNVLWLSLRRRAWEHDYFTSCLPWTQKGDEVLLPIQPAGDQTIQMRYAGQGQGGAQPRLLDSNNGGAQTGALNADASGNLVINGTGSTYDPQGTLYLEADTFQVTTTINDLRTTYNLQEWLEKNARAGSRYIESNLIHFNVRSSDKRLQRPEYIGGSRTSMSISEVLQTSETNPDGTAQGTMAGHGIGITSGNTCKYFAEEHGYFISILSIRPRTAYFQGLPRHFSRVDKMDYYWESFARLGEQAVKNKEIFLQLPYNANNEATFGYIPRYSEYRYQPSRVSGQMQTTLDNWHMARKFDAANLPSLNAQFIECHPDKRIFAVTDPAEDEIVGHIYHKIRINRRMPQFGTPAGLI